MAINSNDSLVAALATSKRFAFGKDVSATGGVGSAHSLWKVAGNPSVGANPSTGAGSIPTQSTNGAIKFTNPTGGKTSYLAQLSITSDAQGQITLADRLWHNMGLALNGGAQAVNSVALTRPDASGTRAELWLEVYTGGANSSGDITVNYTNSAGVASRTATISCPANLVDGQMVMAQLQAGDDGVQSVQGILTAALGVAGDFGLTILRRLVTSGLLIANPSDKGPYELALPTIDDNACIFGFVGVCGSSSTGSIQGQLSIAQG